MGVQNYILTVKRQNAIVIANFDTTLASFRTSFASRVSTIDTQATMLTKRLQSVSASLNPLDLLDPLSRSCAQKYRASIATVESIQTSLAACAATSTNSLTGLLASALLTRNNLLTYYNSNFETLLSNCLKTYPMATALNNYTICVESVINTVNGVTVSNQNTFDTQIQTAQCSGDSIITTAIDCSYSVQYATVSDVGEYTRLIDNCINGLDSCPVCDTTSTCSYSAKINATNAASTNDKINNPFAGLSVNATCVLLTKT